VGIAFSFALILDAVCGGTAHLGYWSALNGVEKGIPQGLKPHSVITLNAWAKAQAYLRSKSNDKGGMRGFFAALRMTSF
jgi:hypothetical protein